jgi:hypothetical protein
MALHGAAESGGRLESLRNARFVDQPFNTLCGDECPSAELDDIKTAFIYQAKGLGLANG